MTKYTTAATTTGHTFTFNSKAKNIPAFAVVTYTPGDRLRADAAEARTPSAAAWHQERLATIDPELDAQVGILSKHATRDAALKARNTAAARPTTASAEIVEIHEA